MSRKKKRTRRGQDWILDSARPPAEGKSKEVRRLMQIIDTLPLSSGSVESGRE